jgi:hypothetical protein
MPVINYSANSFFSISLAELLNGLPVAAIIAGAEDGQT